MHCIEEMACKLGGDWFPETWKTSLYNLLRAGANFDQFQLPRYENEKRLSEVEAALAVAPPLVSVRDIRRLHNVLSRVTHGRGFIVQGGDCAESLDYHASLSSVAVYDLMYRISVVISSQVRGPVVSIGRMAGQYAKPRSQSIECLYDVCLPIYRGDLINGLEFTGDSRQPDPRRMLRAYRHAERVLDTLSSLSYRTVSEVQAVCADLNAFADRLTRVGLYDGVISPVRMYLGRLRRGEDSCVDPTLYTSHEALLLPYEQALTRFDEETECWYCRSAHFLWVGNRTRDLLGPHIEFLRGISNPIGVKLGPSIDTDTVLRLCRVLNPQNTSGRLTLITRMGVDTLEKKLPGLVQAIRREGFNVVWSCDPMHANTKRLSSGRKTRYFDDIAREVRAFFSVHRSEGSYPGALHLEVAGSYVTECVGGMGDLREDMLDRAYHTLCDPRLNVEQALEIAFLTGEQLSMRDYI